MNYKQATFLVSIVLIYFILFCGLIFTENTTEKKIVNCYDKYDNKILNTTCESIIHNGNEGYLVGIIWFTFLVSIAFSLNFWEFLE